MKAFLLCHGLCDLDKAQLRFQNQAFQEVQTKSDFDISPEINFIPLLE